MFIDTHCHFDFPPFLYHESESIQYIKKNNVNKIIVPTVSSDYFDRVKRLSELYPEIYYAMGLHPIYQHDKNSLNILMNVLAKQDNKLVAIGEIGLDNYIPHADLAQQQYWLLAQFDLAKQYHLPVILHSRKTHALLLSLLKRAKLPNKGVIHGFAGSYEEAMQFIRLGFYIGVGGVISYSRAKKTRHTMSKVPLEYLVLETDSPDMPLSGYQGQPNRPEYVVKVFAQLAALRTESLEQIENTIFMNTLTLFPRINTMKLI